MNDTNNLSFRSHRQGFTLSELMIAIFAFGILLSGLVSVMTVSTQTLRLSQSSAARTSRGMQVLSRVSSEIVLARKFLHRTSNRLEFTTADRDGDQQEETIRLEYLADREQLVKSTYLSATDRFHSEVIADNVTDFDFESYTFPGETVPTLSPEAGVEKLLFARDQDLEPLSGDGGDQPGIPGPSFPPAPAGKTVLLVVGNADSRVAHEYRLADMLESLGLTVRTVDDSASQGEFDNELSLCDLVYVPATVDAEELDSKIRNTALGIVTESPEMAEILGLGQASPDKVQGQYLEWTGDSTPLINQQVAGGTDLFDSSQSQVALSGNPSRLSPHLQVLAESMNRTTLACLEKGAEAYRTDSSPGRTFGFENRSGNLSYAYGWNHVGTRIEVDQPVTVHSLTALVQPTTGSIIRFGLYSNDNSRPGSLLAQSGYTYRGSSSGEWLTLDLPDEPQLEAGNYWIVASVIGGVRFDYRGGGLTRTCFSTRSAYDGMMGGWGYFYDYGYGVSLSMYATCSTTDYTAGRRLFVPWSGQDVDLDEMSLAGWKIFERCLGWTATPRNEVDESNQPISNPRWVSQYVLPDFGENETRWMVSRIVLRIRPNSMQGSSRLRLAIHTATGDHTPSPEILAETDWIELDTLAGDHARWWTLPLDGLPSLETSQGICIQCQTDGPQSEWIMDADRDVSSEEAQLFSSTDSGNHWNISTNGENLRFYLFGKTMTAN